MIEHAKIYLPAGEITELHVGTDGITKMFFDKEANTTLVVLTDDHIVTYSGLPVICVKAYKVEAPK